MKYGFALPVSDPLHVVELAVLAETHGWDGVFAAELPWGTDAWVSLTAAAMKTERILLGSLLTPASRMRPWKLASETATLDRISNGRVILAVGLGAVETGFAEFGEATARKTRVELMEESLELLGHLWKKERFTYSGKHFQVDTTPLQESMMTWVVEPVQQPSIPIWLTAGWPREASMQRALKYQGLLPNVFGDDGKMRDITYEDARAMREYATAHRTSDTPFDIIVEGNTVDSGEESRNRVAGWEAAGATWWIESPWEKMNEIDLFRERIKLGPPA